MWKGREKKIVAEIKSSSSFCPLEYNNKKKHKKLFKSDEFSSIIIFENDDDDNAKHWKWKLYLTFCLISGP